MQGDGRSEGLETAGNMPSGSLRADAAQDSTQMGETNLHASARALARVFVQPPAIYEAT